MRLSALLLLSAVAPAACLNRIMIMGDSWGTVSPATAGFQAGLNKHNCTPGFPGFQNIAIGGTTAKFWARDISMVEVKAKAKDADHVWFTIGGNDALQECPECAEKGGTAEECAAELITAATGWVTTILDGIHEANPNAQVVGFGYDIMFGGLGCELVQKTVFPQCWNDTMRNASQTPVRCFNEQFIKIQGVWEKFAAERPYVHALNLLGTSQVAGGNKAAAVGKPDLDHNGPAKYWPDTLACIHPSSTGGNASGAAVIMEEFYRQYWSKALAC